MKLTILSNEEQKAEAVRAIVTAQHEIDAMVVNTLGRNNDAVVDAMWRQDDACEWLSLCT